MALPNNDKMRSAELLFSLLVAFGGSSPYQFMEEAEIDVGGQLWRLRRSARSMFSRLHRQGRVLARSLDGTFVFALQDVAAKLLFLPPIREFSPPPFFPLSLCCIIPPLINVTALLILSGLAVWKFTRVAIHFKQPPCSPGPWEIPLIVTVAAEACGTALHQADSGNILYTMHVILCMYERVRAVCKPSWMYLPKLFFLL